ncbi:sulfotransferase [Pseudomonas tolaasii]|uniref:sulfotransferase n=1 Tax=Pseudomonas tolaasii TaxID=29442 RepID=UPI0015A31820|nr:sulfotransferase [Pseudomonas tolaasii]NWC30741.1 sulfotransferase [Pseudomonas tolaasii]NWC53045.1 sulfotransferase [Pseudomonas tolaasii]NWE66185.1 sulfotransferase [Pseudomonas tolaasii]
MNNAFIIGTGRCGTTYLAQILNAHSKVCVPPEMQCVFEYDTNGSRFYENIALGAIADAEAAADLLERSCPHDLARFFNFRDYCAGLTYPLSSIQDFFAGYYEAIAKSHNKEVLIEQTPWYGQRLDIMTQVFPSAKYIHVVRDGRDVALSFARTPWWFKKAELNLTRWATEIKKIAADAATLLSPENYLVVKYEHLVADTQAEVSRICDFLGITLEAAQLDPKGFIDYDSYCRFDMDNLSSAAYLAWKKNKGSSSSFQGSAYAWKQDKSSRFEHLPEHVKASLSLFGYDVPEEGKAASQNASPYYNVKLYVSSLEAKVADLSEAVGGRELTINDQSVHIRSVESELAVRAKRIVEFEQALKARGEHIAGLASTINDQTQHISSLDAELALRAGRTAALEKELTDRGQHIAGLNNTINEQIQHISGLDIELSQRAKLIADFEAELKAHARHISGLDQTIENLARSVEDHEADRLARIRQHSELTEEFAARADYICELNQLLDDQAKHIAALSAELAMRVEQYTAYEAEVIACGERKAILEQALTDQAQHIQHLGSELALYSERLSEQETAAAVLKEHTVELDKTISAQAQHIHRLEEAVSTAQDQKTVLEQTLLAREDHIAGLNDIGARLTQQVGELSAQLSMRLDRIGELEEQSNVKGAEIRGLQHDVMAQQATIDELRMDAQRLQESLDQLNASWCGRLQAFRQKFHK